jgi:hypothetical protein
VQGCAFERDVKEACILCSGKPFALITAGLDQVEQQLTAVALRIGANQGAIDGKICGAGCCAETPPVWRGGPGETILERCLPPSRSRRVSSAFYRRCRIAAAATPELRNRTTPVGFPSRSICPSRHPIDVLAEIRSALGSAHAFGHSLWQP